MIRLPQRSVTRFFIPLIDVLTLLFCIFLVMPLAQSSPEDKAAGEGRPGPDAPRQEKLQDQLAVRVLEIDGRTGKLSYRAPERIEVRNQDDARALIERDRRALGLGPRKLYYLILYPRDPPDSGYPTQGQRDQYDRWFKDVALGYDVPGAEPGGGTQS
jgi:hypothetical protein